MSKALGYPRYSASNLHYGKLGRLVAERLSWHPLPGQTVFVLATFEKPEKEWYWIIREEVAKALEQLGLTEGNLSIIPEEVDLKEPLYEGAVRTISVNAYERNNLAREKCILYYGCTCAVCGSTLAEKYGEVAQGLIHVHHLHRLSDISEKYEVDPIQDLRPVCPNCHTIIHISNPPYTIEEVTGFIEEQKKEKEEKRCEQVTEADP